MLATTTLHRLCFLGLALLLSAGQGSARCDQGLTIINNSPDSLDFGQWEYRELSTRGRAWPGCWGWDILGPGGWFPSTWYELMDGDDQGDNSIVYEIDRSARASYCAAEPDEINLLEVSYGGLSGYIRVVPTPDASGTTASIKCAPKALGTIETPIAGDLVCELVELPFTGREAIEVTVELDLSS
ncbi:expressed unknown protein [Seminavis robusta]|uniref:Uncharacterized protein n=1 Tax=Seminavis robusta TaxID=568900 RepID=A0A9N8HWU2_9STRA|nr:expressed unknown protein [Seminavis robusta]|eukprot:Sro2273_g321520.1 n/a (185) ;mRNA; r:8516-9070